MTKHRRRSSAGFTLTEVMIAMVIVTVLGVMTTQFLINTWGSIFVADAKNAINSSTRELTNRMNLHARQANRAFVYASFAKTDRDTEGDRRGVMESGDFLLLVFLGTPDGFTSNRPVTRLIGYYRDASVDTAGPVRCFDIDIPVAKAYEPIESLIPSTGGYPVVIQLSEGLSDGRLFYVYQEIPSECIMVNGLILHGSAAKRVTDTYNFSISTRN